MFRIKEWTPRDSRYMLLGVLEWALLWPVASAGEVFWDVFTHRTDSGSPLHGLDLYGKIYFLVHMIRLMLPTGATVGGGTFRSLFFSRSLSLGRVTVFICLPSDFVFHLFFLRYLPPWNCKLRCANKLFSIKALSKVQSYSSEWLKCSSDNGGAPPTVAAVLLGGGRMAV